MKIKFTNWFNNNDSKERKSSEIDIKGKCVITNYDTREREHSKAGDLTISADGNNVSIKQKSAAAQNQVDMNKNKYSIFTTIAGKDGDSSNLTLDDLKETKKDWKSLMGYGVKDVRFDEKAGVATIVIGEEEILRIDFETEHEKKLAAEKASASKTSETKTDKTDKTDKTKETKKAEAEEESVEDIISSFKGGAIDIKDVKDMASVAKYTGLSASYIKDILVGIEGNKKFPVLTAEYDNVPDKDHPNGHLTIGFGHTNLTGKPKITEGMEITEQQAYQILANDIMTAKKMAKNKLGKLYDDAPKSIKDSLVDLVFNKGPGAINKNLKANLEAGYYHSAARRTWYETTNTGLQKRNIYRFLAAIKGLSQDDKTNAVKNFYNEHVDQMKTVFKKDNDAKKAWNDMCKNYKLDTYSFS